MLIFGCATTIFATDAIDFGVEFSWMDTKAAGESVIVGILHHWKRTGYDTGKSHSSYQPNAL